MGKNENYNIVYASDDNFSQVLGISILSLFENNQDVDTINLYILDNNISQLNKKYIEEICANYDRKLPIWIESINIEEKLGISVQLDRGSISQYARLFISRHLPEEIHRVLYLDCDIIINKSIKELWDIDLQGKTIGALMDAFSKYYRQNIELEKNDIMFNSGVMLIDLDKWIELHIEDKLMDFIIRHRGRIQQGDQGALNAVLSRETFCIEPRFNSVTIFYDFSYSDMLLYRNPPEFYTKEEICKAINEPVIIHFTTSFLSKRPWIHGCKHKFADEWKKYKEMSPWNSDGYKEEKVSKKMKAYLLIFNFLPWKIALRIASFFQVYVRPIKRKLLDR